MVVEDKRPGAPRPYQNCMRLRRKSMCADMQGLLSLSCCLEQRRRRRRPCLILNTLALRQVTADKGKTNTSLLFELAQQQVRYPPSSTTNPADQPAPRFAAAAVTPS